MLQRNDTDTHRIVAVEPPIGLAPGEVVDWPDPICGLVPAVDEPAPVPDPDAIQVPELKRPPRRRAADSDTAEEAKQ